MARFADKRAWTAVVRLRAAARLFAARHRIALLCFAAAAFVVFLLFSAAQLELDAKGLGWRWLGWAATTIPLTMIAGGSELALCARAAGQSMPLSTAITYSAAASVANILPLPGSMLVRARALLRTGAGWIESGAVLAAAGLLWLAMATACVGLALPSSSGSALLGAGALSSVAICAWIVRRSDGSTGLGFLLVRAALLLLLVLRLFCCFAAVGQPVTLRNAAVFTLAGVVGNGVAIVPSGLGVAEGIGALMASLVGALASAAFVALGINRLLGLTGNVLVAALCLASCKVDPGARRVVGSAT